jgi:hypothetical protein
MNILSFSNSSVCLLGLLVYFLHILHLHTQFHLILFGVMYFFECIEEFILHVPKSFIHLDGFFFYNF